MIDSRLIIGLIRLVGMVAGTYVVVSVFARIRRGQWLSSIGPFKVQEAAEELTRENTRLQRELRRADDLIRDLEADLARTAELLEQATGNVSGPEDAQMEGGAVT